MLERVCTTFHCLQNHEGVLLCFAGEGAVAHVEGGVKGFLRGVHTEGGATGAVYVSSGVGCAGGSMCVCEEEEDGTSPVR